MEGPGVLRIASLIVDGSILAAFSWLLLHGRTPRRWLGTLGLLTGVALLNLTQSVIALGEPAGPLLSTDRLVHAGEVAILAATVVVFRREMLQPTRLLGKVASRRDVTDSEIDGIVAPVVSLTRDGVVRHANARAAQLLGVDQASLVGTDLFRFMGGPEQRRQGRQAFLRFVGSAGTVALTPEHRLRTPEGEVLIRWHASAQVDRRGAVVGVVYYGEDLTERRRVERQLEAESQLLDSVREAVLVSGPDGRYLYFNRAAHDILGLTRDEFQSLSPWEWLAPDSVPLMLHHLESVHDAADDAVEVVAVRRDGTRVPLEVHAQRIEFDGQDCSMTVMRDVSSRHQAQSLMTRMAFTDPLTGLPNRRAVEARLGHLLGRCREGGPAPSVLYLDVDNVKSINDSLGHDAGDRLISIVGERLQSLLREGDMVGRMGGDEFVIVLRDGSHNGVSDQVAQRLLEGVGVPLRLDGHELRLGSSIGVVDCRPEMSVEEAIISADRAMYTAKRSGGRCVVRHEPAMDEEFIDRFTLKNDLARALELREFSLDFQPIVAAGSGRVVAAEALLRWRHPERGILAPGAFIALAEQAGITRELGRWVIAEACAALVAWRESGVHLERVTVNVSPFQLRDHFFVPDLLAAIALHGLQPGNVEVEITESEAIEHLHELEGVFVALREAGVRIALDDFGVGHSSLERLRRLPIATLKLDRTFVADLCTTSEVHPIVDTVLVLASNLRLDVVAEGVETSCQADYLRDAGCQLLQGFAFARPMDAASFGRFCTCTLQAAPCVEAEGCPGRAGAETWGLMPVRLSALAADLA